MTAARTALVIGGGVAGPASALALQQAGLQPIVFEARSPEDGDVGWFLTVASNGIRALRLLGADARVLAAGFPTPRIELRSTTGKRLGATMTGRVLPDGTTSQSLGRAELHHALRDEALERGIELHHGKRLVEVRETSDHVVALFADGTEHAGDVLVGCDGLTSTVRRCIDPSAPAPTFAGLLNTAGRVHGVAVDVAAGSYEMIFGRRAFFGYATAGDGEVWWFANLPCRDEPAAAQARVMSEDERRRSLELFDGDHGPATALIAATASIPTFLPIHTMPHLPTWHSARMVLTGDAAHAPSPSSGQGASLALEDAIVLAAALRDHTEPQAAFRQFVAARRPRVEQIIRWAARMNSSKAAGPVGRVIRDALMPTILRATANGPMQRRLYDHPLHWNTPTGAARP